MEGIGLNAAARVFGYAKTTILNWEKKLSGLQETLFRQFKNEVHKLEP
jgi:hypothetical protein